MSNISKYVKSLPNLSQSLSQLLTITRGFPTLNLVENRSKTEVYVKNSLKESKPLLGAETPLRNRTSQEPNLLEPNYLRTETLSNEMDRALSLFRTPDHSEPSLTFGSSLLTFVPRGLHLRYEDLTFGSEMRTTSEPSHLRSSLLLSVPSFSTLGSHSLRAEPRRFALNCRFLTQTSS